MPAPFPCPIHPSDRLAAALGHLYIAAAYAGSYLDLADVIERLEDALSTLSTLAAVEAEEADTATA